MLGQKQVQLDVLVGVLDGLKFSVRINKFGTLWTVRTATCGRASGLRLGGRATSVNAF